MQVFHFFPKQIQRIRISALRAVSEMSLEKVLPERGFCVSAEKYRYRPVLRSLGHRKIEEKIQNARRKAFGPTSLTRLSSCSILNAIFHVNANFGNFQFLRELSFSKH